MADSDANEKNKIHLDYLLEDFRSLKSEIARRSSLQRVVLLAYVGLIALVIQQAATSSLSSVLISGLWSGGALALLYSAREALEISRLGTLIEKIIAPQAGKLLEIDPKNLLPSQTVKEIQETEVFRSRRRTYNVIFYWVMFLILPLFFTLSYGGRCGDLLGELFDFGTLTPWLALLTVVAACGSTYLLNRHWSLLNRLR